MIIEMILNKNKIMCEYNEKYYFEEKLHSLRPALGAIHTYRTNDGIIIGMFQGRRGQFPELDFIIKILKPGIEERPFPPIHTLWVVDLILKIEDYRDDVRNILEYYINFYNIAAPFNNIEERANYQLMTVNHIIENYSNIEQEHTLSLEYVAIIIELFCLNEKRNEGAYMFRNLLQMLLDYVNGNADYIDVIRAAQPGF